MGHSAYGMTAMPATKSEELLVPVNADRQNPRDYDREQGGLENLACQGPAAMADGMGQLGCIGHRGHKPVVNTALPLIAPVGDPTNTGGALPFRATSSIPDHRDSFVAPQGPTSGSGKRFSVLSQRQEAPKRRTGLRFWLKVEAGIAGTAWL